MRSTELEDSEGTLTVKLVLLEYDSDVYGDLLTQEDLDPLDTRIPNWWVENSNASIVLNNIAVVSDPDAVNANLHDPASGTVVGTTPVANLLPNIGTVYSNGVFVNIPINVPANVTFNQAEVKAYNMEYALYSPQTFERTPARDPSANTTVSYFDNNDVFNFSIDNFNFARDTNFQFEVKLQDTESGSSSLVTRTGNILLPGRENVITPDDPSPGCVGAMFSWNPPDYLTLSKNVYTTVADSQFDMRSEFPFMTGDDITVHATGGMTGTYSAGDTWGVYFTIEIYGWYSYSQMIADGGNPNLADEAFFNFDGHGLAATSLSNFVAGYDPTINANTGVSPQGNMRIGDKLNITGGTVQGVRIILKAKNSIPSASPGARGVRSMLVELFRLNDKV